VRNHGNSPHPGGISGRSHTSSGQLNRQELLPTSVGPLYMAVKRQTSLIRPRGVLRSMLNQSAPSWMTSRNQASKAAASVSVLKRKSNVPSVGTLVNDRR